MSFGIYLLANDRFRFMLEAFLVSLRKFDETTPVMVIPFDDDYEKVSKIANQYNASILSDSLSIYSEIGSRMMAGRHGPGIFRKFKCFHGPFDEFLFIDIDVTVTSDIAEISKQALSAGSDITFSSPALARNFQGGKLVEFSQHLDFSPNGYNNAVFVSKRDAIPLDFLTSLNPRIRTSLLGIANEQALMNYCSLVLGLKVETIKTATGTIVNRGDSAWRWDGDVARQGQASVFCVHWSNSKWANDDWWNLNDKMGLLNSLPFLDDPKFIAQRNVARRFSGDVLTAETKQEQEDAQLLAALGADDTERADQLADKMLQSNRQLLLQSLVKWRHIEFSAAYLQNKLTLEAYRRTDIAVCLARVYRKMRRFEDSLEMLDKANLWARNFAESMAGEGLRAELAAQKGDLDRARLHAKLYWEFMPGVANRRRIYREILTRQGRLDDLLYLFKCCCALQLNREDLDIECRKDLEDAYRKDLEDEFRAAILEVGADPALLYPDSMVVNSDSKP